MAQPTQTFSIGSEVIHTWMAALGRTPFDFQKAAWKAFADGDSGLVNAPTGCGKTFSIFLGAVIDWIDRHPHNWQGQQGNGLQLLWITPLRALAKDLHRAMQEVCDEISLPWQVGLRTGDTGTTEKSRQRKQMPEVLIITPESLHLLLALKDYPGLFRTLRAVAVDEWHELLGTKRGVQVELALSRLRSVAPGLRIWGISATIGNLREAADVLLGPDAPTAALVQATGLDKRIEVVSVLPDEIERFPWSGHLGVNLLHKIVPILENCRTALIFTNTRRQTELWYHALIDRYPEYAGRIALHHSAIDGDMRLWVEDALHQGALKAVVCTSSLDLGVDFRPVDTVVQIGSPKGIARFLQRAGRSGHAPGETSRIYFLPTHALELLESAALQEGVRLQAIEDRTPIVNPIDVLVQYLVTLSVGEGFRPEQIWPEVKSTFAFRHLDEQQWQWCLRFIMQGGDALGAYDEFRKVVVENGLWRVTNRSIALRHRLHIGAIVSEPMLRVRYMSGGAIGAIEEFFISTLKPGDAFSLGGRVLEFVQVKDMEVYVRRSQAKNMKVPAWMGGRISFTNHLSHILRRSFELAVSMPETYPETLALQPLIELQARLSAVPGPDELLMEYMETADGCHLFVYPLEGRYVHEVLSALLAFRIGRRMPVSFSIAMNDYGFELLAPPATPLRELLREPDALYTLLSVENLMEDVEQAINATEMAKRRFRDIAAIGGLVFQGFPGKSKSSKHLQASSQLFFGVFSDYDPDNLLLRQAYQEVYEYQIEETRLRAALDRIQQGRILFRECSQLTPFCFPIKVDAMRERMSSEKLEDRVRRLVGKLERG